MDISIAHSPDADDRFFFWPLKERLVDSGDFNFKFQAFDTATLNREAERGTWDVIAISLAHYPKIAEQYLLLEHGASVGINYGPALVRRNGETGPITKIGVPGTTTTASALARLCYPNAEFIEIPILPFEAMFQALNDRLVDAAVLIHEGQLAFKDRGLTLVQDLGEWWSTETGTPLVLGVNVLRTALGMDVGTTVSKTIKQSIQYALEHQAEFIEYLLASGEANLKTADELKRYLEMYANRDSLKLDFKCKVGVQTLLEKIGYAEADSIPFVA